MTRFDGSSGGGVEHVTGIWVSPEPEDEATHFTIKGKRGSELRNDPTGI